MSTALYRAILTSPDNDTPRLAYADWLDENDRPEEAEFIRVGVQLEALPPDHPDYVELEARQEELSLWLATHVPGPSPRFAAGLELSGSQAWWHSTRRGFPCYFEFGGERRPGLKALRALAEALENAFAKLPTRWLVVRFVTPAQLAELLRQPVIEQLDALTVQLRDTSDPQDDAARVIAEAPRLRNLRGLVVSFDFGEAGAVALARSENLGRLEQFTVDGTVTAGVVRSLGTAAWFRNLTRAEFDGYWPDPTFEEFSGLDPFPRLHTLRLPGTTFPVAGWQAFARSKTFPALRRLELPDSMLSRGRAAALFGATWLRPSHLNLINCSMGTEGAEALAAAPWLGSLRSLNLFGNLLTPSGVAAVARCRKLTGLKSLDLSANQIGARGLEALARNPALRGLCVLRLRGRSEHNGGLTPAHLRDFLTRLDMPQLRHLSLSGRPVGGLAARVLTEEKFRSLTRLELGNCKLTDAAVAALIRAPALQNLIELSLAENKLHDGLKPLGERGALPRLAWCSVYGNRLDGALSEQIDRPGVMT